MLMRSCEETLAEPAKADPAAVQAQRESSLNRHPTQSATSTDGLGGVYDFPTSIDRVMPSSMPFYFDSQDGVVRSTSCQLWSRVWVMQVAFIDATT